MIDYLDIFKNRALTYNAYRAAIDAEMLTSLAEADDDAVALRDYTKMNIQRMNRLDKTVEINAELKKALQELPRNYKLLVISEGWCGDAAQIVPVLQKMTEAANGKLDLRLVWRDKEPELIDAHLTNGGKAIPVLLVLDGQNGGLLAKWGPRPAIIQQKYWDWKKEGLAQDDIATQLHGWYAKDKTQTTQEELAKLIQGVVIGN